jgi:hypothetical protein
MHCSASYCMLVPPQVVRNYCRSTSMFVVKWVSARGGAFDGSESIFLAKAAVQGRTMLVNAVNYGFDVKLGQGVKLPDGRFNLISVVAHELGHAFGLSDIYDGSMSIMAGDAGHMSKEPTDDDARRLAAVLEREIKGQPPGVIDLSACAGLKAS